MTCAMHRSSLPCLCEKWEFVRGRLDKCFLVDRERPSPVSLQFLPDLHTELEKSWKKPYSTHIFPFQHLSYSNVERIGENGYVKMPPVEEPLAGCLSQGEASSLKAVALKAVLNHGLWGRRVQ